MKADIEVRYAAHPDDIKNWDIVRLRREHLLDLFSAIMESRWSIPSMTAWLLE